MAFSSCPSVPYARIINHTTSSIRSAVEHSVHSLCLMLALLTLSTLITVQAWCAEDREPATAISAVTPDSETERLHLIPRYENWSLHAQTTWVLQSHDGFDSPYAGTNSLSGDKESAHTWTITAFFGCRLWHGAEIYFNPEMAQGSGLSGSVGVAGFPNGEATRAASPEAHFYFARYFFRQTIGFGEDHEAISDDKNQIAGQVQKRRFVLTIGKVAANDFFDNNRYAHDARSQFLNWGFVDAGAWDYPADARGYTNGAIAEIIMPRGALRIGTFMEPTEANGLELDDNVIRAHGDTAEIEGDYALGGHPGKSRLLGFVNHANAGTYREAMDDPSANLDIAQTRSYTTKSGLVFNLEQEVVACVGVFLRAGWNDGKTETWAFTEIDRSLALGLAINGDPWSRPGDTLGVGGLINGLSPDHRDYLAAGGIGFIIGDGQLNYATENIFEFYYSLQACSAFTLSADYQLVENPGYNRDRGPVSIYGVRAHLDL